MTSIAQFRRRSREGCRSVDERAGRRERDISCLFFYWFFLPCWLHVSYITLSARKLPLKSVFRRCNIMIYSFVECSLNCTCSSLLRKVLVPGLPRGIHVPIIFSTLATLQFTPAKDIIMHALFLCRKRKKEIYRCVQGTTASFADPVNNDATRGCRQWARHVAEKNWCLVNMGLDRPQKVPSDHASFH